MAKAVANPQLAIKEYDVIAGHSAAVGRVDDEQLYYLMSRGLTKTDSLSLIIMSNLQETVKSITDTKLLKRILKIVKNKIA